MLKKVLLGLGVLVLLLAGFFAFELYVYPKARIASATHQAAPDFTLSDAAGSPFTLSSQRGHKACFISTVGTGDRSA
jgi:hypothetical protein